MNILITAPYHEQGRAVLQQAFGEVTYKVWKENGRAYTEDELDTLLTNTHADALITEHDQVTGKVLKHHPHLRFLGVCRGTPSNVDLETARALNIPVFHTPARNAQAVAEMVIANVIIFLRQIIPGREWLRSRHWKEGAHDSYLQFKGNELAGKTVGMVGFGAVGQCIARMLSAFPCNIIYYDPFLQDAFTQYKQVSLDAVFENSDIVSVHLPVNADTKDMIGKELLRKMKTDAIFVNTARAVVVNRADLLETIASNRIRGAILDVFDHEPPDDTDYRLIDHPNVLATPHIAGATHEVEDHHVKILNEKLLQWKREAHI